MRSGSSAVGIERVAANADGSVSVVLNNTSPFTSFACSVCCMFVIGQ
jgi:hypothetical protein